MRSRIALTADLGLLDGRERVNLPFAYVQAVLAAGGVPLVIPPADGTAPEELLAGADGLLLIGGGDLDPCLWGEAKHPKTELIDPRRQRSDLALLAAAEACGMPVLCICLGCQEMAAHRGGRIVQHVADEVAATIDHSGSGRLRTTHSVTIEPDSLLARVLGARSVVVNSSHHQVVREAGGGMRVVARSPDSFVEGIEDPAPGRFFLGVQWHPEVLIDRPPHLALFEALCRAAADWAKKTKEG